jgi:hypothetical protein
VDQPINSSERALRASETANIVAATSPAAVRGGTLTLRGNPLSKEAVGFLSGPELLHSPALSLSLFTEVHESMEFSEVAPALVTLHTIPLHNTTGL